MFRSEYRVSIEKDNLGSPNWTSAIIFSQGYHWIAKIGFLIDARSVL